MKLEERSMVKKLDVDALLAKNPGVDREAVKNRPKGQETPAPKAWPSSPYSGPRLVADEKSKLEQGAVRKPRSYYAPY